MVNRMSNVKVQISNEAQIPKFEEKAFSLF